MYRTRYVHCFVQSSNVVQRVNHQTAAGSLLSYTTASPISVTAADENNGERGKSELINPNDLGPIPYPKSLSPSAVMEFKNCPQSYLFQYLYGIRQPQTLALAKGSMCHDALERLFDFKPEERTLDRLKDLFRIAWGENRNKDNYKSFFQIGNDDNDRDLAAERAWGESALQLLENYYRIEDPRKIERPNPVRREVWLRSDLSIDPTLGSTGYAAIGTKPEQPVGPSSAATFHVRGIVDRLDMVRVSNNEVALQIVDYKTGKSPHLKYTARANERIIDEAFYQLKVYALLLREKDAAASMTRKKLDLRFLRLLFLTSTHGDAEILDMDLGATQQERDEVLQEIHQDLSNVWKEITHLVALQDPKAFIGCSRKFCYCHDCRNKFVDGTLWEPRN